MIDDLRHIPRPEEHNGVAGFLDAAAPLLIGTFLVALIFAALLMVFSLEAA